VYEHIVYAPHQHTYFATLPGMWSRTLSCSSLSKTYSITGWRLGYIIAPEEIIDRAKKVHDFLDRGLRRSAPGGGDPGPGVRPGLLRRAAGQVHPQERAVLEGPGRPAHRPQRPGGAYYVLLDISEYGYESDLQFCKNLAREVGVGAVPGSSFFREPVNHLIRLHFAKNDDTLNEALNRLERIQKLKK
jgi:aminotransferase